MPIVATIEQFKSALGQRQPAFVPTMGALHAGHLALVKRAAELRSSSDMPIVVSIFVNPTQFGPNEDYRRYPRMLEADAAAAIEAGADVIFAPEVETMYPPNLTIPVPPLPAVATEPQLEDAHRPTHFAGVCQVVARLFDLVKPSIAIFGEKDYQQLRVIQEMVKQESHRWSNLTIVAHPTVREASGLAMRSRNAYLTPEHRDCALGLNRALDAAALVAPQKADDAMREVLEHHDLKVDYATIRDAHTLMPVREQHRLLRALIAARIGNVRLIDNMAISAS